MRKVGAFTKLFGLALGGLTAAVVIFYAAFYIALGVLRGG